MKLKFFLFTAFAAVIVCLLAFRSNGPITVNGKITDESGKVFPGVIVTEKGSGTATVSDVNGDYKIVVKNTVSVLTFSHIGFVEVSVKVGKRTTINVALKAVTTELKEVVVLDNTEAMPSLLTHRMEGRVSGIALHSKQKRLSPNRAPIPRGEKDFNTESYDHIGENRFLASLQNPLSTFSIDVDAASYSNIRRFINQGQRPPAGAVRIEEMINYFDYNYKTPTEGHPFSVYSEIAVCPWSPEHQLVSIGLQAKRIDRTNLPPANLVFLVDVSGSMMDDNKLPLVKTSLKLLVEQLREEDRVAMVVYAGNAGVALPATSGSNKAKIREAIDALEAGGSTAGGAGVTMAYKIAEQNFNKKGNNRVILCTDGDFNIGESSDDAMERLIEEKRKTGVFLTVLGYGMGNYKDSKMQKLADKGNGNHAYIDDVQEAKKVLVNEFGGTLFTIAKDVKLQVEFNPAKVQAYRLIGYENRILQKEDFNNDVKDAGDMGSGHTVTALYEIIPVGIKSKFIGSVDDLKYQTGKTKLLNTTKNNEWMTVKIRYKQPDGNKSQLFEHLVTGNPGSLNHTSENFRFSSAVAAFGMLLRNSEFKQGASFGKVLDLAKSSIGEDKNGYRKEFLQMVQKVQRLD